MKTNDKGNAEITIERYLELLKIEEVYGEFVKDFKHSTILREWMGFSNGEKITIMSNDEAVGKLIEEVEYRGKLIERAKDEVMRGSPLHRLLRDIIRLELKERTFRKGTIVDTGKINRIIEIANNFYDKAGHI